MRSSTTSDRRSAPLGAAAEFDRPMAAVASCRRCPSALLALLAVLLLVLAPARSDAQIRTFELDTLLVTGASRLPGGAVGRVVTLLDHETLLRRPVSSVSEALGWVLGADLQSRSPATSDLALRGASYEGVLVLVDGVRMSDPQTGHFDLDLAVPLERVERVEVLLGPASAQFGADAVGGVVNIVTRSDGSGGDVRAEAGTFGRWAVSGAGGAQLGEWVTGGGVDFAESDGHRAGTDYRMILADAYGEGPLGSGRLRLAVGHGRRDFGAADFYGPFPAYERTRTSHGSLQWTVPMGRAEITPRLTVRRHVDDFFLRRDDPEFYHNEHTSDQVGGDVVARVPLGAERVLAVGGEWTRESLASNNLGDREQDRMAVFSELTSPVGPGLASLGIRADRREGFSTFVSPSLSFTLPVGSALHLRAQAGRAFRTPTWTERFYTDPANIGTPDLEAERSWSAELGLDASLPGDVVLRATVFRRESEDLIDWARVHPDSVWRTRNVEAATFDGLELSGGAPIVAAIRLSAYASWLTIDSGEAAGFASKSTLRPLITTLGLAADRTFGDGWSVRVDLRGRKRAGEASVLLTDARIGVPVPFGELYVSGTNLTDATYLDVSRLPAAGRALVVGLRASARR